MREVTAGPGFVGRLPHGCDRLLEITRICRERGVRFGRIEGLGAVRRARLGFYDQSAREYHYLDLDRPLEIAALVGNVSLRDGEPVIHAHVTLADEEGRAFGGHLAEGTLVFACELFIQPFEGTPLHRAFDHETGLPLWEEEPR